MKSYTMSKYNLGGGHKDLIPKCQNRQTSKTSLNTLTTDNHIFCNSLCSPFCYAKIMSYQTTFFQTIFCQIISCQTLFYKIRFCKILCAFSSPALFFQNLFACFSCAFSVLFLRAFLAFLCFFLCFLAKSIFESACVFF